MISSFFILLVSGILLLMPLVFWMYIFTNVFPYAVSRFQFIIGIIIGAISSIPLVFHDKIFLGSVLGNIFFSLSQGGFVGIIQNFIFLFFCIFVGYFIISYIFQDFHKRFGKIFFLSGIGVLAILTIGTGFMLILQNTFPAPALGKGVGFGNTVSFVSVGGILAYYLVISLLEEGNKYISSLSFSGKGDYFLIAQKYLSLTACIALGFAFFENILYAYFYVQNYGVQSSLISLVFFRSIFTVILHLMSSMLFALGFWYIIGPKNSHGLLKTVNTKKILYFFVFASLGILSHVMFDSALSFGYMALLIFYIFLMYILMSYMSVTTAQGPENTQSL